MRYFTAWAKKVFTWPSWFKIKEQFTPVLKKSLELGRSFIRKEYQQKPLPLFLLWKGILKYLMDNPRYQYLIGPVSISNSFSNFSKSLIVDYINRNHFDYEMAQYVRPRKKFKVDFSKIDTDTLLAGDDSFKGLDNLISDIETHNMKVPVLYANTSPSTPGSSALTSTLSFLIRWMVSWFGSGEDTAGYVGEVG